MQHVVPGRKRALFCLFFVTGLSMASWVTRTPAVRDGLGATHGEMGIVLFGLALGSFLGILSAPPLLRRLTIRRVIAAAWTLQPLGLGLFALGGALASAPCLFLALFVFGLGIGSGDVAINVAGAEIERLQRRPFLSALHGFFSLGMALGSALGIGVAALEVSPLAHLAAVLAAAVPLIRLSVAGLPRAPEAGIAREAGETGPRVPLGELVRDLRLLLIGVMVLAMALAEGAAYDWLPLLMVDGHGFSAPQTALAFSAFTAAMAVSRFAGNGLIRRFGRVAVMRGSAGAAGLGLALVIFADLPLLAGAAALLWGLGAALGFPLTLSAAGDAERGASERVGFVTSAGYLAFLVGPPLIGFLGDAWGLRGALLVVLAGVLLALLLAPALSPRRPARRRWPRGAARSPAAAAERSARDPG